jgi:hypothetical protein
VAILGSLDHFTRHLIVHTSPTKRSSDFIAHLEPLDHLCGQTFAHAAALDQAIHQAVTDLNRERTRVPLAKPRSSA